MYLHDVIFFFNVSFYENITINLRQDMISPSAFLRVCVYYEEPLVFGIFWYVAGAELRVACHVSSIFLHASCFSRRPPLDTPGSWENCAARLL